MEWACNATHTCTSAGSHTLGFPKILLSVCIPYLAPCTESTSMLIVPGVSTVGVQYLLALSVGTLL